MNSESDIQTPEDLRHRLGILHILLERARAEIHEFIQHVEDHGQVDVALLRDREVQRELLSERFGEASGIIPSLEVISVATDRLLQARFLRSAWRKKYGVDIGGGLNALEKVQRDIHDKLVPMLRSVVNNGQDSDQWEQLPQEMEQCVQREEAIVSRFTAITNQAVRNIPDMRRRAIVGASIATAATAAGGSVGAAYHYWDDIVTWTRRGVQAIQDLSKRGPRSVEFPWTFRSALVKDSVPASNESVQTNFDHEDFTNPQPTYIVFAGFDPDIFSHPEHLQSYFIPTNADIERARQEVFNFANLVTFSKELRMRSLRVKYGSYLNEYGITLPMSADQYVALIDAIKKAGNNIKLIMIQAEPQPEEGQAPKTSVHEEMKQLRRDNPIIEVCGFSYGSSYKQLADPFGLTKEQLVTHKNLWELLYGLYLYDVKAYKRTLKPTPLPQGKPLFLLLPSNGDIEHEYFKVDQNPVDIDLSVTRARGDANACVKAAVQDAKDRKDSRIDSLPRLWEQGMSLPLTAHQYIEYRKSLPDGAIIVNIDFSNTVKEGSLVEKDDLLERALKHSPSIRTAISGNASDPTGYTVGYAAKDDRRLKIIIKLQYQSKAEAIGQAIAQQLTEYTEMKKTKFHPDMHRPYHTYYLYSPDDSLYISREQISFTEAEVINKIGTMYGNDLVIAFASDKATEYGLKTPMHPTQFRLWAEGLKESNVKLIRVADGKKIMRTDDESFKNAGEGSWSVASGGADTQLFGTVEQIAELIGQHQRYTPPRYYVHQNGKSRGKTHRFMRDKKVPIFLIRAGHDDATEISSRGNQGELERNQAIVKVMVPELKKNNVYLSAFQIDKKTFDLFGFPKRPTWNQYGFWIKWVTQNTNVHVVEIHGQGKQLADGTATTRGVINGSKDITVASVLANTQVSFVDETSQVRQDLLGVVTVAEERMVRDVGGTIVEAFLLGEKKRKASDSLYKQIAKQLAQELATASKNKVIEPRQNLDDHEKLFLPQA